MIFIRANWLRKKIYLRAIVFLVFNLITGVLTGCNYEVDSTSEIFSTELNNQQKSLVISTLEAQKNSLNLCTQQRDQNLSSQSVKSYYLNKDKYLVEILCFLGAYQPNYQYFLVQFNNLEITEIKPIIFTTFQDEQQNLKLTITKIITGLIELDWQNKILTVVTQGRSLGDCGSFATYKWHEVRFELEEFRYKENCDGIYLSPEDYPLIYP